MANAVHLNVYKLKKGASVPDFLEAVEKLNNEEISRKKGYLSSNLMFDGETWVDSITFETKEDLENFVESARQPSEIAQHFYSFINFTAKGNRFLTLSVEKEFSNS